MSVQPGASSGQSSGSQGASGSGGGQGGPAPAQRQGQGGGGTAAGQGGQDAGFDFRGELARTKAELTQGLSQQFGRQLQDVKGGQSKSDAILAKLAKAFQAEGEGQGQADPHATRLAQLEAEMDSVVEAAYEADKRGQPIPLTAKANITALQTAIQMEKFQQSVMAEIKKLQGGVNKANDPGVAVDRQAFGNMDSYIAATMDQIYGMDDAAFQTKKYQFQAVTSQMSQAIGEMKQTHPDQWEQIRRSPQLQRQMTDHFVKQMLPPRAVQMMEQEHLQNTELTTDELWSAFRESKDKFKNDPETGVKVRERIRQQILERSFGGQSGASGGRRR